jgi:hypothetical protein
MANKGDDLSKRYRDQFFLSASQGWELGDFIESVSEEYNCSKAAAKSAIDHCLDKTADNNPVKRMYDCLDGYFGVKKKSR